MAAFGFDDVIVLGADDVTTPKTTDATASMPEEDKGAAAPLDGMPTAWEMFCSNFGTFSDYLELEYMEVQEPVPSNISPLDELLGGGFRKGLNTLGGSPGSGKSAFGIWDAMMMALSGTHVVYLSLEMTRRECIERCASFWSLHTGLEFPWNRAWQLGNNAVKAAEEAVNNGTFAEYLSKRASTDPMVKAIHALEDNCATLQIIGHDVTPSIRTIKGIEEITQRAVDCGCELIIVDYLQYIDDEDVKSEYERVTDVSKRLNALGQRYSIPVIALSANSREANKKASGKDSAPSMHGFKGSGGIDYDSVLACVIEEDPDQDWKRRVHIVKNRAGGTTTPETCIHFSFDGAHNSFELLD